MVLRDLTLPYGRSQCWRLDVNAWASKQAFTLRIHRLDDTGKEIDSQSRRLAWGPGYSIVDGYTCPQTWPYWKVEGSIDSNLKAQLFAHWITTELSKDLSFPGVWPTGACKKH